MYAKAHAVVLDAVGNGSLNAGAPIPSLGESIRTLGADVGGGDVVIAVGDGFEALVLDQHILGGTALADGSGGVGTVGKTTGDMGDNCASLAVLEEVALLTVDAASSVVDGDTVGGAGLYARTTDGVVEVVGIAVGAVKVVLHLEASPR